MSVHTHLRKFREISATDVGITRLALTKWEKKAHDAAYSAFSRYKGIRRVRDKAGNTFIVNGSGKGPYLVMGSHLDTVPHGGWLDGSLGVAAAIEAMQLVLREEREAPIAVAIWADEEGYRFGNGLWGSRVYAGQVEDSELLLEDREGKTLAETLARVGLQKKPEVDEESEELKVELKYERPIEIAAYAEAHIEQGRRLVDAGKRIGVVTSVAGIRRWKIEAMGESNHAGTTPMRERRDALVPVAGMIGRLPQLVRAMEDAVITCGDMGVGPGAANVIPDHAWAIVEHRGPSGRTQDEIARRLKELVASTGPRAPGVALDLRPISEIPPVLLSEEISAGLETACEELEVEPMQMVSMAGHDAMSVASVAPAGLFFIPSLKGISHRPDEDSREDDIELSGEVLHRWALGELERVL